MSGGLPGIGSSQRLTVRFLIDNSIACQPETIVLDSGNTDTGSTPNSRFRAGNVVVYKLAITQYVEANDSTGDRGTAAAITTSGHTDGNGEIKLVGNHGTISVTTTTGAGTEANNATDLNADAIFKAHYVASSAAGELTITSLAKGAQEWFYMHTDTMATPGFAEGEANGVNGADADYRVTLEDVDLIDRDGTAQDAQVASCRTGYFDESALINLTDEARAVLLKRGARFG